MRPKIPGLHVPTPQISQPQPTKPKAAKKITDLPHSNVAIDNAVCPEPLPSSGAVLESDNLDKKLKNLKKKHRQIIELDEKKKSGQVLSNEQLEKLGKISEIEEEIERLQQLQLTS
jgi:partner of Y14 and mago protein